MNETTRVTDEASTDGSPLRDYFAARCLNGLITATWPQEFGGDTDMTKVWADAAYMVADAMLEARKVKP